MKVNDVSRSLFFVAREGAELMRNDPALALRTSATMLSGSLMSGVNTDSIRLGMEKTIVPTVRTALLALDTIQAVHTFRDPERTALDKTMDCLRVATDLMGFVGGVALVFVPRYASLGGQLVGAAYSADIVSHAYRGLTHADRRVKFWQSLQDAQNPNPNNDGKPPGPPTPPPPPPTKIETIDPDKTPQNKP